MGTAVGEGLGLDVLERKHLNKPVRNTLRTKTIMLRRMECGNSETLHMLRSAMKGAPVRKVIYDAIRGRTTGAHTWPRSAQTKGALDVTLNQRISLLFDVSPSLQ